MQKMVKMSQFRPIIKPQLSNNKWNPVGNSVIALQAAQLKDVQVSLELQNKFSGTKWDGNGHDLETSTGGPRLVRIPGIVRFEIVLKTTDSPI